MTDNEIIKALECCSNGKGNMCSKCPKYSGDNDFCQEELHRLALDLITCQAEDLYHALAANERLKGELSVANNDLVEVCFGKHKTAQEIKAEAVREFAERLKKHSYFDDGDQRKVVAEAIIDHYLKEMVGDAK